jgi:acyl-CoA dehydrogenase
MVEFSLSDQDRVLLEDAHREALIVRKYSRYYDTHEHEVLPDELEPHPDYQLERRLRQRSAGDTAEGIMALLLAEERAWGDWAVPLQRRRGALGNAALAAVGTPEQRQRWRHLTLAMAMTEPGCGSDTKAITTTAVRDGERWVLNGEKIFVTTGERADGVVVWATIDKTAGRAGIKAFFVEKDTPGFTIVRREKKMGLRASDTVAILLQDCRIPSDHLLGGDATVTIGGSGDFRGAMQTFNMTRPMVAMGALGIARAALELTRELLEQAGITFTYGPGLPQQSAIVQTFFALEAEWEAAYLTSLHAAWLADQRQPNALEAAISKAKGGKAVATITQKCLELLGPLSYTQEFLLEKWFRDAKIFDIFEGTQQIQHLIIARHLLGFSSEQLK